LQLLYERFQTAVSGELAAGELEEYQLRAQERFFITHDVHFDGVAITKEEFREIADFSRALKDMARSSPGKIIWRGAQLFAFINYRRMPMSKAAQIRNDARRPQKSALRHSLS
jgi:hypothetical protein